MRKILQWIGGIFVVLVVIGIFAGGNGDDFAVDEEGGDRQAEPAGSDADYEISNLSVETGELGNEVITGTLENKSGRDVSYIQVEINLYDSSGAQVGSTMANVNNLAAGQTWHFEAMPMSDFDDYEVAGVTGF